MRKNGMLMIMAGLGVMALTEPGQAGKVEWDFSPATLTGGFPPVLPSVCTLGGTVEDWMLDGNPDNYDNSAFLAVDFSQGYLHFLGDASISGNLSLLTSDNFAVRDLYALSGPGDRLWLVCDHQMIKYGHRANLQPGTVDRSRGQLFWVSFLTSNGTGLGIQYVAGNYNSEDYMFFTAIGNADESQDGYLNENRLVEETGDQPNLTRRTVYIRVTENGDNSTVTVDVKYDNGTYRTIDAAYAGAITSYPAGDGAGDENYLACTGNNSGSGAIEFNMYKMTITDEDPEGVAVREWSLY